MTRGARLAARPARSGRAACVLACTALFAAPACDPAGEAAGDPAGEAAGDVVDATASGGAAPKPGAAELAPPPLLALDELVDRVAPAAPERPLLVNFWATWCVPCLAELPALAAAAAEHAGAIDVVAVSLDLAQPLTPGIETAADVQAFLRERGIDLPVVVYDGSPEALAERLDLPGPIPFTYAWSRAGRRVGSHSGMLDRAGFDELIEAALR